MEISNAYYLKYQDWYVQHGFGERPIITDAWCQGRQLDPFLGFYQVQLDALQSLWMAMHEGWSIPLVGPASGNSDFKTSTKYDPRCAYGKFEGFVSHYHQTARKIDCAGLDIVKMLEELRD